MRVFKFRAWDKKKNRMIYDVIIGKDFFATCWDKDYVYGDITAISQNNWEKRYVIMQFTGLRDKNGREIFEGDIVNINEEVVAVVRWDEFNACFFPDIRWKKEKGVIYDIRIHRADEEWEVVGNIFENPDLLKKRILDRRR